MAVITKYRKSLNLTNNPDFKLELDPVFKETSIIRSSLSNILDYSAYSTCLSITEMRHNSKSSKKKKKKAILMNYLESIVLAWSLSKLYSIVLNSIQDGHQNKKILYWTMYLIGPNSQGQISTVRTS